MTQRIFASLTLVASLAAAAHAQVPTPGDPGLLGITSANTWKTLSSANYSTFPVNSEQGSGAALNKLSGGSFFASSSLYGGFSTASSNYDLVVGSALAGLNTVVFQARIGQGYADFSSQPTLTYYTAAGGTGTLSTTQEILAQQTVSSSFGNVLTSLYKYQWDLSDISDVSSVTSFKISFGQAIHSTLTNIRLDQSSFDYSQPVPEPASMVAVATGAVALLRRRRK